MRIGVAIVGAAGAHCRLGGDALQTPAAPRGSRR